MNKTVIIVVIIVLAIAGGVAFKMMGSQKQQTVETVEPTPVVEALPTITSDVVVALTAKSDNKAVVLKISSIPSDVESIEYELTYTTAAGLPRGVLGKITVDGEKEVSRDDIVLGTCSSGKCVYDTGVEKVDLSLKFNSPDGAKVFQKSYDL